MQVGLVESGDFGETVEVADRQFPVPNPNKAVLTQGLQGSIDMDGRHSGGVRQLGLGKRKREGFTGIDQIDNVHSNAQFAE